MERTIVEIEASINTHHVDIQPAPNKHPWTAVAISPVTDTTYSGYGDSEADALRRLTEILLNAVEREHLALHKYDELD